MDKYVVVATHDTGHGEVSNPVMITSNVVRAVNAARGVEVLGYEFYGNEIGATVYRMLEDCEYCKNEFSWHDGRMPPRTMVFSRLRLGGEWKEEWFDNHLQQRVDGRVSARGKK